MLIDEYREHGVWDTLEKSEAAIENCNNGDYQRSLSKTFGYIRWILETSDPDFIAAQELNQTSQELTAALAQLHGGEVSIQNYSNVMGQLSKTLARLPYPRIKKIFRTEANDILTNTLTEANALETRLLKLSDEIREATEKANSVEQKSEEITLNLVEQTEFFERRFSEAELENKNKVASFLADKTETFAHEKSERAQEFATLMTEMRDKNEEAQKHGQAKYNEGLTKYQEYRETMEREHDESLHRANALLSKIDGVFQEAGQTLLAGGFAESAREEMSAYRKDSNLAKFSFAIAALVLSILAAFDVIRGTYDISRLFEKLPISLVLLLPGIYFAGLASKHRKEAFRLRSVGLRVKAFDAFINSSDDEIGSRLREQVAPYFFMSDPNQFNKENGDLPVHDLIELAKAAIGKLPNTVNR